MIGNPVECYLTTADGASKLQQQPTIYFDKQSTTNDVPPYCILFLSGIQFQQMDGFGGSFTDSSSYLIMKVLSESSRQQLMQSLFSKTNGIQLGFVRQPMGATDFSRMGNAYTYDETEGDSSLSKFSINKDKENIIPCLQLAKQMNPQLLVMLTPWSVPSWCKTNNSILGTTNVEAHLKPECYPIVANYLIKTIQAYSSVGIPIYAMTVQNEPLYAPTNYAGCIMTSQEQINFISNYLGPLMKQYSISTKLLCFDHNFDHSEYPLQVLSDGKANAFVSGTAFHPYTTEAGHDVMSMVHDVFPDKEMYLTEASGGNWIPQWESAFLDQMQHMIRAPRNWCKAVVYWNIALDPDGGPCQFNNKSDCRGFVTIDPQTKQIEYNVDYYTMGHLSKFVDRGAYRIATNWYENQLECVGFYHPKDACNVLLVCNRTKEKKQFQVQWNQKYFEYWIPCEAAITFRWYGQPKA